LSGERHILVIPSEFNFGPRRIKNNGEGNVYLALANEELK